MHLFKNWVNLNNVGKEKSYLKPGHLMQKILILILGGISLTFKRSPSGYMKILDSIPKEWEKINRIALRGAIRRLYQSRLISGKDNSDGSTTLELTDNGKRKALTYDIKNITLPRPKKWDEKWRIILFDVPEKFKNARDALAISLKKAGFYRLQKSVFVYPFPCQNELDFIIEFWNVRPFARFMVANSIDNELEIMKHFNLL